MALVRAREADCWHRNQTYTESYDFPRGSDVYYRFWRESDTNGAAEEIREGQITIGELDQVVAVDYEFEE